MSKKLSEMTLEELWKLFPISLTKHDPCWADRYIEEVGCLRNFLPFDIQYFHIGSTAVKDIMAKPIVDILAVVDSYEDMVKSANILKEHDYIIMSASDRRISLNKGYTEDGFAEKVFHIHIRLKGDIDEVYFKDYLISHPQVAKEYENLKLKLWKEYEYNRDAYTDAKSDFVKKYTEIAKKSAYIKKQKI